MCWEIPLFPLFSVVLVGLFWFSGCSGAWLVRFWCLLLLFWCWFLLLSPFRASSNRVSFSTLLFSLMVLWKIEFLRLARVVDFLGKPMHVAVLPCSLTCALAVFLVLSGSVCLDLLPCFVLLAGYFALWFVACLLRVTVLFLFCSGSGSVFLDLLPCLFCLAGCFALWLVACLWCVAVLFCADAVNMDCVLFDLCMWLVPVYQPSVYSGTVLICFTSLWNDRDQTVNFWKFRGSYAITPKRCK